jgi:hypothetical protein
MSATLSEAAVDKLFATKVFECDDLLCHILTYTDNRTSILLALVSKGFQRCVANPASWKGLRYPKPTKERYYPRHERDDLFAKLVRALYDKGCLAKVKIVHAFMSKQLEEAYIMLCEQCPSFISGDFEFHLGETEYGCISAWLTNKWGPPRFSKTLRIGYEDCGLEDFRPDPLLDVRHEPLPSLLESIDTHYLPDLNGFVCASTLQTLVVRGPMQEWFADDSYKLKQLPKLRILKLPRVMSTELTKFIEACPNVESFAAILDQIDRMGDFCRLENHIELLKHWQLKTLSLVLKGRFAADETRDYDAVVAYIRHELPSVEHFELIDKRS